MPFNGEHPMDFGSNNGDNLIMHTTPSRTLKDSPRSHELDSEA